MRPKSKTMEDSGGRKDDFDELARHGRQTGQTMRHLGYISFHSNKGFDYESDTAGTINNGRRGRPLFLPYSPSREYFESRFQGPRSFEQGSSYGGSAVSSASSSFSSFTSGSAESDVMGTIKDSGRSLRDVLVSMEMEGKEGSKEEESLETEEEDEKDNQKNKKSDGSSTLRKLFRNFKLPKKMRL